LARHSWSPAHQPAAAAATTVAQDDLASCSRCTGAATCRSCAQRRKHAWRLVDNLGLTYEQAADRMRLTPGRVRLLVAQERDHQDLERYRLNQISTELVRSFLERELERNPGLTRAELAHYLNMQQIDLDRQLGYEPGKNGRKQRHIGIPAASRLAIALGRAPHELDGC
jgi:hypothetical protein